MTKKEELEDVARNQFGMPVWMLVLVACGVPIEKLLRAVMWFRGKRKHIDNRVDSVKTEVQRHDA